LKESARLSSSDKSCLLADMIFKLMSVCTWGCFHYRRWAKHRIMSA